MKFLFPCNWKKKHYVKFGLFLFLYMRHIKIKINTHSFTLLELLYVVGIISIIMPAMFALYNFMIKSNREISARQSSIQQWYEFFERLNIMVEDYRIDYEEYFNRQMVWCVWNAKRGSNFERNVWTWWYCTNFTTYWNWNSTNRSEGSKVFSTWYHDLYYCSSTDTQIAKWKPLVVKPINCGKKEWVQSYGQYAAMFTDVKWWDSDKVWNGDDEDVWYLLNNTVRAIMDSDNIQELYLISQDWKNRLYFRRKLIGREWDYMLYRIQMLRLKWFDAWRLHSLYTGSEWWIENRWVYDGKIDTWACDYSMWFVWKGAPISSWGVYSWYRLPIDENDCWIDMTYWVTNVLARNITVSPTWNPDLYWARPERQINDYIKIFLANWVYMPAYGASMAESIADFKVPLQTTINMAPFYK